MNDEICGNIASLTLVNRKINQLFGYKNRGYRLIQNRITAIAKKPMSTDGSQKDLGKKFSVEKNDLCSVLSEVVFCFMDICPFIARSDYQVQAIPGW